MSDGGLASDAVPAICGHADCVSVDHRRVCGSAVSWPGIPDGKGSTCAEEGCGNKRRRDGNECRACYKHKWIKDKRAKGKITDGAGGYEVGLTDATMREMDADAYRVWRASRDEFT